MDDLHELIVSVAPRSEREPVPPGTGQIRHDLLDRMAKRLRSAQEDEVQLEIEIAHVLGHGVGLSSSRYTQQIHGVIHWSGTHPYAGMAEPCPTFTRSLDAAMALAFNTPGVDALELLRSCVAMLPAERKRPVSAILPRMILVTMLERLAGKDPEITPVGPIEADVDMSRQLATELRQAADNLTPGDPTRYPAALMIKVADHLDRLT